MNTQRLEMKKNVIMDVDSRSKTIYPSSSSVSTLFDACSVPDTTRSFMHLDREQLERVRSEAARAALRAASAANARIKEAADRQRAKRQARKKAEQEKNESHRIQRHLSNCISRSPKKGLARSNKKYTTKVPSMEVGPKKNSGTNFRGSMRKIRDDVTIPCSPFSRESRNRRKKIDEIKQKRQWVSNQNQRPNTTFDETLMLNASESGDPYGVLRRNIFRSLKF